VRVKLVIVGQLGWELTHDGLRIWSRTDANIVALDRANEAFSHAIALLAFDRRRSRLEPDIASEATGIRPRHSSCRCR
jgi:hypothetical protein